MAFADQQTGGTIIYGEAPAIITLAGTTKKGDGLGYSGGWQRALGTTAGVIAMRAVAGEDGVSGQTIVAYFGKCVLGGRFSGATANGAVYVAEGTAAGQYTQTAPSTSGDLTIRVGVALNATELAVYPTTCDTVAA